jgi:hypothetical protein
MNQENRVIDPVFLFGAVNEFTGLASVADNITEFQCT